VNDQLVHLAGWFPMHKNSVIRMIGRDARSIHGYSRDIFPFDSFDTAMATVRYSCEQSLISLNRSSLIRRPQRSGPHKSLHVPVEVLGLWISESHDAALQGQNKV
jgi:hypothetical protein